jgi:spoIIIJ-associated protein
VAEIRRSGPSVEEAVEAALRELGLTEQDVDVEVVQEPRAGLLGVGAHEAIVVVRARSHRATPTDDELEEQAEVAAEFLEGLLERMGIAATVEPNLEDGTMYVDVIGPEPDDEDMGLLIGRHGQTLESLQELARVVVAQRTQMRPRIVVDVEDYRKRQVDRLVDRARDIAERVAASGREEALEPMNPFMRKVVHDAVAHVSGAESGSEGQEPDRYVVIRPRR